jgi:hypothetical protein
VAESSQLSLIAPPRTGRARRTDPITSRWAGWGIDVNRRQGMVLDAFVGLEQATHDELIDRVRAMYGDVAESTVRTGCSELEELRLVECLGAIGSSRRGKPARVYRRVPR